jgi:hypothetical protein
MSTVLVLGSGGALGRVTAEVFASAGWQVHEGLRRGGGPRARRVDLDDAGSLSAGLGGVDLILQTVPDRDLRAEAAVLEQGGLLINLTAGPLVDGLLLRARCPEDARGTVVLNGGLLPGVTSLIATELLSTNPKADLLELALTLTGQGYSGTAGRLWVHRSFSDAPRHRTFEIPLPQPYGTRRAIEVAEADRGWLIAIPSGVDVRCGVCVFERDTEGGFLLVNKLGLMSLLPRRLFLSPPRYMTRGARPGAGTPPAGACAYWVAAYREGRRVAARTVGGEDDYRATAISALCCGEALLARTEPASRGVHSVEELLALGDVLPALTAHGVQIVER